MTVQGRECCHRNSRQDAPGAGKQCAACSRQKDSSGSTDGRPSEPLRGRAGDVAGKSHCTSHCTGPKVQCDLGPASPSAPQFSTSVLGTTIPFYQGG